MIGAVLFAAVLSTSDRAHASFDDGVRAYLDEDYATALDVWRPLAEAGLAAAQFGMGLAYENGRGVLRNEAVAAGWYRQAAEQGLADAQFNLGNLYLNGKGVERDASEAVQWFKRAAEQGMPHAQVNLGFSYEIGSGIEKDVTTAVFWYRKAALQDFGQAQFYLGAAYERGVGVTKNLSLAAAWYRRAADRGVTLAQERLVSLLAEGVVPAEPGTPGSVKFAETESELADVSPSSGEAAASTAEADTTATTAQDTATPAADAGEAPVQTASADGAVGTSAAPRADSVLSGHRVRLAAYREQANAERGWKLLHDKHSDLLGTLDHTVARVDLGAEKGVFYRLEAGPLDSADRARAICDEIKRRGDSCLPLKP